MGKVKTIEDKRELQIDDRDYLTNQLSKMGIGEDNHVWFLKRLNQWLDFYRENPGEEIPKWESFYEDEED